MVPRFGRRLLNGKPLRGKQGRINPKVASNPKKEKKIIKNIQKEDKKIDKDIEKLLKESKKNSWNIKELEKITKDSLNELMKYIKSLKNLYRVNLNRAYPEIIQLEKHIENLYKILEEIKKKGPSMNLEKEFHNILNEIYKLWEMHKHKISKT
jgi:predicted RNase H-like nuclease (RuvC/YqgF family)